ncbi:MAG TPA: Ig-like domain-containing protein, partial [Ilumatobacteraceae bacterium]|nr:Ig-like domain-containing protein [Ilumatobacteraceae bacterium]
VDGGPKAIASATDPAHGTVALTGGVSGARTGLTYQPNAGYCNTPPSTSLDTFGYTLTPGGSSALVTIVVSCVDEAPVVTVGAGSMSYVENDAAAVIDATLTVIDSDDTTIDSGSVTMSSGFAVGDVLSFTNQLGISGSYGASTGVLSLTGSAPVADYQAALRSVRFASTADNLSKAVVFAVNDGDATSAATAGTKAIAMTGVNDSPTITATGAVLTYLENDGAVVVDPGLTIGDPDSAIAGATVAIKPSFDSLKEALLMSNQLGIVADYNSATGVLTLSGTTTAANYQEALQSMFYFNGSDSWTPPTRSIEFQVTDTSGAASPVVARSITPSPVDDAPVNSVPVAQATDEDTPLLFATANLNAISVADVDAGSAAVQVTLSVSHGTLTPTATTGVTITGSGSATVQLTGALTPMQSAIGSLRYEPAANFNSSQGAESLVIVTNDQGNTGAGGPLTDTDTVAITVNAMSDSPIARTQTFGSVGTQAVQTNMGANLGGLLAGAIDPDSGDAGYSGAFHVVDVSATTSPAGATVALTDATLGTFSFTPPAGATGSFSFAYTISDGVEVSNSSTATVFVGGTTVWFVNANAAVAGTGTLSSPFKTLAPAVTAIGADTNERIFLYSGTYSTGVSLKSGGWIVGQQVTGTSFDSAMGVSPPAGTFARPPIATGTAIVQGAVVVTTNATVRGISISTTSAKGLVGTSGTGISVSQTSVTTVSGTAVDLDNAQGTYNLSSV